MSDMIAERRMRIVLAMDEIGGPAPIYYISKKSGVDDAQELLRGLEQDDIVGQVQPISESMSKALQYALTGKAKKLMQQLVAAQLEQLVNHPQVVQVRA